MYTYKVSFSWVDKLGISYEYVHANNDDEARKRVKAMYGDKIIVHTVNRQ